jgi:AraC-like DNA-binding protein
MQISAGRIAAGRDIAAEGVRAALLQEAGVPASVMTRVSMQASRDVNRLLEERGGTSEITPLGGRSVGGNISRYAADTGALEFPCWDNIRVRGAVSESRYSLGVFLDSSEENTFMNGSLPAGSMIFFKKGDERDAVYRRPIGGAFAFVDPKHLEALLDFRGFKGGVKKIEPGLHSKIQPSTAKRLILSGQFYRDRLRRNLKEGALSDRAINFAYQKFLDDTLDGLAETLDTCYRARDNAIDPDRLVTRVEDLMRACPEEILTVNKLSDRFQVSRQAMRRAFKDTLGVTTCVYIRNWRLARAREGLQQGRFHSVTEAALHWGFLDFGRFSGYYAQLFGELPSTTLKHTQGA